jgi:hypothetical protein
LLIPARSSGRRTREGKQKEKKVKRNPVCIEKFDVMAKHAEEADSARPIPYSTPDIKIAFTSAPTHPMITFLALAWTQVHGFFSERNRETY